VSPLLVFLLEQGPRLIYLAFSAYAAWVVCTRWQASRVMTQDKRFLMLFFLLEIATTMTSGVLKISAGVHLDVATWMTVLLQSFLAAYLHYAIPRSYRFWHRRWAHPARRG
jgi:hypothetical protein